MNNFDLLQNLLSFVKEGSFFSKPKFEKDKFINFLNTNQNNSIINQTIQNQNLQDNFQIIYTQLLKQSLIEIENYTKQNPQNKSQEEGIIWREAIKEQDSLLNIVNTGHFDEIFQKIVEMNKNQNKKSLSKIFRNITGENPKIRSAILATILLFNITTTTIAQAQENNNPVSQIKQEQIIKQEMPGNFTNFQKKAWEIGIKNHKENWWFEMILKNPNLESFKQNLFVYGIMNKMEKWYFELVLENKNLSNEQIWAFETGTKMHFKKWYFEMIPKLFLKNQVTLWNNAAKKNQTQKYFEIILNLKNNEQIELFAEGQRFNMNNWYYKMIYDNSNLSFIQEKIWKIITNHYQNSIKNEVEFKKLVGIYKPLITKNWNFNLTEFLETTNYNLFTKINDKEISKFFSSNETSLISEYKIMVSYYLSQRNLNPTTENVNKALKIIIKSQKELRNISIYKNRNIIFIANNEIEIYGMEKNKPRFNKNKIKNYFELKGKSLKVFSPTLENYKTIKENIIKTMINTQTPLSIHFEGHGSKDGLYLIDGSLIKNGIKETKDTIKLTVEDLTQIFLKRNEKFGEKFKQLGFRDIVILSSCYNATFNNALFKNLAKKVIVMPILIGTSEEGQVSYSNMDNPYGTEFLSKFMKLNLNDDITIDFLIKQNNTTIDIGSNPSMFISGEDGKPIKIM